jgi:Outer membrane receptor for monomeric catechols
MRDTIDLTRWLQVIGAGRYDRFDESALDLNTGLLRKLDNDFISPAGAVILKPAQNMSFYTAYMVSYLPASGDQFSALADGTVILKPQKFTNEEVGFKWNIAPRLLYTAAVYNLDRENVPLPDPNNPGFFILSGKNRIRGFESELKALSRTRGSPGWDTPIPMRGSPAIRQQPFSPATAYSLSRTINFRGGTSISSLPSGRHPSA